jgi:ribosomal protein S18 acetylase RimI-like enzyme
LIARGRHCLIAWRNEQPVGYTWVSAGIGPDVSVWPLPFQFPSDAAYLWNLYVLPSERSSGIGTALARARLQLARELGFREGWRMVAPTNRASLRTVQKIITRFAANRRPRFRLTRAQARFFLSPMMTLRKWC